MSETGIIILAAGNSSRLGRPKQLLPFRGKTLLTHVVAEAVEASLRPVVTVTGAYNEQIRDALEGQGVDIIYNPAWETGMASGILAGLAKIGSIAFDLQAVIIAVCDQPYISAELLRSLVDKHAASGKGLIACAYSGTMGTPVLFARSYFKELSVLSGDAGAKQLLKRHPADVETVPFPAGSVDIDTEADLQKIQ